MADLRPSDPHAATECCGRLILREPMCDDCPHRESPAARDHRNYPAPTFTLPLDDYEIRNLREGLLFLRACGGDTGDWLGQILMKLPEVEGVPNKTATTQQTDLATRVGWMLLWPTK